MPESAWHVRGCFIMRGTRRNRTLIGEFGAIFRTRFPASGDPWFTALAEPEHPLPPHDGLRWTDVAGTRLIPARLRR